MGDSSYYYNRPDNSPYLQYIDPIIESNYKYGFKPDIVKSSTMTYILGSRCNDGVVLVADKKFMIGNGTDYESDDMLFSIKLGEIPSGLLVGFSGSRRSFELFQTRIHEYMLDYAELERNSEIADIRVDKVLLKISEITHDLYNKFHLTRDSFDILVGISPIILHRNRLSNSSLLKYIYENGALEPVNGYKAIGNGAPFGSIYLKQNWSEGMTMKQVAELGYFIIKYIERFQLDLTVGVNDSKPQIWFMPDTRSDYCADPEILNELEEKTEGRLKRIEKDRLHKLF